jgi:hypothetical protein
MNAISRHNLMALAACWLTILKCRVKLHCERGLSINVDG